jgi:tRNA U54 and U55 pseudouridine synthase Pus10
MANSNEESTPAPITHPSFHSDIYMYALLNELDVIKVADDKILI